jgi:hypothetical protein
MDREKRGMPWRKPYDDSLSMEQKGQRAYEVRGRTSISPRGTRFALNILTGTDSIDLGYVYRTKRTMANIRLRN